jgi:hypothetical protein
MRWKWNPQCSGSLCICRESYLIMVMNSTVLNIFGLSTKKNSVWRIYALVNKKLKIIIKMLAAAQNLRFEPKATKRYHYAP